MIIALLAAWVLGGLLLALLVGGAVRVADARRDWTVPADQVEVPTPIEV
ncbi:hypothetical protein [Klenkia terrae]|uniref:Uncharacterized protein n=1 Tax=Klenkia terrae TaxID=1052259 RepID=A0ABU8ECT3_9ACTN|nr:hypothetical protein [Klenkia terrae]